MSRRISKETWAAVRSEFELGADTIATIAERHGMGAATVSKQAIRGKWRKPGWRGVANSLAPRLDAGHKPTVRDAATLERLLRNLASGLPMMTAAPLAGISAQWADRWGTEDEAVGAAIAAARAAAEAKDISTIRQSEDWKAIAYLLGLQRGEYARSGDNADRGSNTQAIQVIINVPKPDSIT